jgi:hypothetical protein
LETYDYPAKKKEKNDGKRNGIYGIFATAL